jgi:hypothetical protein
VDGGLTSWGLAHTVRHHATHEALIHETGVYVGPPDGLADDHRTKLRGRCGGKTPHELANGRSAATDDDSFLWIAHELGYASLFVLP